MTRVRYFSTSFSLTPLCLYSVSSMTWLSFCSLFSVHYFLHTISVIQYDGRDRMFKIWIQVPKWGNSPTISSLSLFSLLCSLFTLHYSHCALIFWSVFVIANCAQKWNGELGVWRQEKEYCRYEKSLGKTIAMSTATDGNVKRMSLYILHVLPCIMYNLHSQLFTHSRHQCFDG